MMSVVLATMLASSAMGISLTTVAPVQPGAMKMPLTYRRPVMPAFDSIANSAPELKWLAGVDGKSDLEVDRFECGVCGGSAGGCPACGGFETPNAGSITEDKSELEAGRFECGVCGGSGGGCPACGSPIFEARCGTMNS